MSNNSSKQIKLGAIISYITIAFNMIAGLIYTPWMISSIGKSSYGLYTLATSLITMFVMDFGMSAAVSRFVAKYNAEGNQEKVNNFLGVVYKMYLIIDAVIFTALLVTFFLVDKIYVKLTVEELGTFKGLYLVVGLFSIISFPFTNLNAIMSAYEHFAPQKLCDLFNKASIIVAMVVSLLLGYGVFALVLVNAIAGLLTILLKFIIIKKKTPIKVNFRFFDKTLLKAIFGFSVWTTVSSLMQRLIFNITPSILAAVSSSGTEDVAIFGLATTLEGYVYTFATAINGLFMPRVAQIISQGKRSQELMPLMIKIGRIQFMLIGLLTVGFLAVGRSFITDIWRQVGFEDTYLCAVFLILPSVCYLPMQIANTTLIVENKVKLQAMVFIVMGVSNLVLSLFLSHFFGAMGAAISIFIAYMIRTILMGIVHHRVLKFDMKLFAKEVYLKLAPQLLIALMIGIVCELFNPISNVYLRFFINGGIVVLVYGIAMCIKGLNLYEKKLLLSLVKSERRHNK